jgi:energy-coupling factor transporter ATP-binding protein EcfA2
MKTRITVSSPIADTPRVAQVRGMFDLQADATSSVEWNVDLPIEEKPWSIGLIVGPSGCGKSTIARQLWPAQYGVSSAIAWPASQSVLDAFPASMPIREVTALLSCVGFSSPPAWLRPFHVLSTGQQFRVTLARLLAEAIGGAAGSDPSPQGQAHGRLAVPPIVFDEFTSVVDRTVAQVGSAALARAVRQRRLQFVAVTCHEDVEDWLQPDWVYRPAERAFAWRSLRQRRPTIRLEITRCNASAWALFAPHHYLSDNLNGSCVAFLATWQDRPICFSAWLPFVGGGFPARREHRTVCLPDYQGIGIGNAVSDTIASMWRGLGYRATSTTTHPAMIESRRRSPNWKMTRKPSFAAGNENGFKHATTRLTASFQYVGSAMNQLQARMLLGQ